MADPTKPRLAVTIRVDGAPGETVDLAMPTWLPGVYMLYPYARAVGTLAATDGEGRALAVTRADESTWRVASGGRPFAVRYELDVSGRQRLFSRSQLHETIGVLQGASLLYLPAHRDAPVSLSLELPEEWRTATSLEGGPLQFAAKDYDELLDSPILFGRFKRLDATVRGIPFSVVVDERVKVDVVHLGGFVTGLAGAQIDMFGTAPFRRYLFLYMLSDDPTGVGDRGAFLGLEHDESTIITLHPSFAVDGGEGEVSLAEVTSHELFHAWNVRAIRPEQLVRPDYAAPPTVRSLWLLEGATSYYAKRFVAATLFDEQRGRTYLYDQLAASLQTLEAKRSIEEMSLAVPKGGLDALRPIYPRGEALAFLLDLRLRADSEGRVGLDDVIRHLYREEARAYREEALPEIVREVSGRDYSDFFRRHVAGSEKPPVKETLALAGLRLGTRQVGALGFVPTLREDSRATAAHARVRDALLWRRPAAAAATP